MKPYFVELCANSPVGLRAQAAAAVDEARRYKTPMVIIGLDGLASLDDEAMSAIIVALRRARETGGTVRLVTRSAHHCRRLSVAGLDRIFEIFGSIDDAQPVRARAATLPRVSTTRAKCATT
jgi:anti-anti-sigma factor